ncbi:MAG: CPBP family intramembrane glutamic endopeptidase [Pseudomonadota bacterium]
MPPRYTPFEDLIKPARETAQLSRLILGIVLVVVLFVTFLFLFSAFLQLIFPAPQQSVPSERADTTISPIGLLLNLYTFLLFLPALALTLRTVHNRSLQSLFGDLELAKLQFISVARYLAGFFALLFFLMFLADQFRPEANLSLGAWIVYVPFALPAIFIQTSAEELLFRGYLQSQIAARFSHPFVWLVVPSSLFGFLHYEPEIYGDAVWYVVLWAAAFGVAAADITARAGTIGPAISFHFCNNCFAILLVSTGDSFNSLSLFTQPFSLEDILDWQKWAPVEFLAILNSWLIVRLAIRR